MSFQPIAPILRLPEELTLMIFKYFVSEHPGHLPQGLGNLFETTTHIPSLLMLLKICRQWRQVAAGNPLFFNRIPLQVTRGFNAAVVLTLFLQMSKNQPLHIYIRPDHWRAPRPVVVAALRTLAKEFSRIKTLVIETHRDLFYIFPKGLIRNFRLEDHPSTTIGPMMTIGGQEIPSLIDDDIRRLCPYWIDLGEGLTKLDMEGSPLPPLDILRIIDNLPNLQTASFMCQDEADADDYDHPDIKIATRTHDVLYDLEVVFQPGDIDSIFGLLKFLQTPQLKNLTFRESDAQNVGRASMPIFPYQIIGDFIRKCQSLDMLRLQCEICHAVDLVDLLWYVRNIHFKILELSQCKVDPEILLYLEGPRYCAWLEKLVLWVDDPRFDYERLVSVTRSRLDALGADDQGIFILDIGRCNIGERIKAQLEDLQETDGRFTFICFPT